MMPVRIARLRPQDHSAAVELWRKSGLVRTPHLRDSRRAFVRQLRLNRGLYLGAYDGRRLVGVVLGTHDTRKGWVNHLAVDPAYQRRGIGTRLLRACERGLARKGLKVVAALVNPDNEPSLNLFRQAGYEATDIVYVRKKSELDA